MSDPIIDVGFVSLVSEMRQAQKEYFRTRSTSALQRSKQLEKKVDAAIRQAQSPQQVLPFDKQVSDE